MNRVIIYCQLSSSASPVHIAKMFLWSHSYEDNDGSHIRHFKGGFYKYEGTHYKELSRESLTMEVLSFLQSQKALGKKTTRNHAENIVMNIGALNHVPDDTELPCFLKTKQSGSNFIGMKNGIFDFNQYRKGKSPLRPHTSDFFSLGSLPFDFDPKADCPTWKRFIGEVLPESDSRLFTQEWFGYNLTDGISHHKFVLMVGTGANGKSVVCIVLRALVGKNNISAVPLEQFNPERAFPLCAMIGKKANVVEEIGEVHKVAEDILKNLVSGGEINVDRKFRDAGPVKFSVKLTFASNVVPRFRDRTDGLWRRIVFVPFSVQILDPRKQNRNFTDSSWWIDSGEMPGILNWSLEGLKSLSKRGYFLEPLSGQRMKDEYKAEANPAITFILDHCEIRSGGNLCSDQLYGNYMRSMKSQGGNPLGKSMFTREVKKIFPTAILSTHARAQKTGFGPLRSNRSRVWLNVGLKK